MKTIRVRDVSPTFHRIPHFNSEISNMTHDDISISNSVKFPLECYIQEKVDGANLGVSWLDGPIVRNRNNVLRKGYLKNTPAKIQFRSTWNWVHNHEDCIQKVAEICKSPVMIFGEWMYAEHSIHYNKLPDLFLAYDIWSLYDDKFLSPNRVSDILSKTNIKYINPVKVTITSIDHLKELSEVKSNYGDVVSEGIVVKTTSDGQFLDDYWKVVNSKFVRRVDFTEIIKNKLIKVK